MGRGLDFEWLEDFDVAVKVGNFVEAAIVRELNASTLNRRISSLEAWVGATLLNRDRSPMVMTSAGKAFYEKLPDILQRVKEAKALAQKSEELAADVIPIWTVHTLAATYVPEFIRRIREAISDDEFEIKTSISVGEVADCVEVLSYGSAPYMLCYQSPDANIQFVNPKLIHALIVGEDRLIAVCPKGERDFYTRGLKGGGGFPFLSYSPGTYLHEIVSQKIAKLKFKLKENIVGQAQMADTLRNLVRAGQGLAWVLESTAQNALQNEEIDIIDEDAFSIKLEIVLFRSATADTSKPIERLWSAAKVLDGPAKAGGSRKSGRNGGHASK